MHSDKMLGIKTTTVINMSISLSSFPILCVLGGFLYYLGSFANPTYERIISMITNIKYAGNRTIATLYSIAPVRANPLLFKNNPRALKITAIAVHIKCGITRAVAIPAPNCSKPVVPLVALDQYIIL